MTKLRLDPLTHDYSYLDQEPVVYDNPVTDALARKEGDRDLLERLIERDLDEFLLRVVVIVTRAEVRGQASCSAAEIAAFLSHYESSARVSHGQANRLVEAGVFEVVDSEPRSYRLVDRELTLRALRARGIEFTTPRPRSRPSGLAG